MGTTIIFYKNARFAPKNRKFWKNCGKRWNSKQAKKILKVIRAFLKNRTRGK
jgi:hypothetical protein